MSKHAISKHADTDQTDWARVDAMTDADIDFSEIPEWTEEDVAKARRRGPQKAPLKEPISIRLSPQVVAFFKATGPGWQTRLDAVLCEYVATHRPAA